jgi:hypothetical protein
MASALVQFHGDILGFHPFIVDCAQFNPNKARENRMTSAMIRAKDGSCKLAEKVERRPDREVPCRRQDVVWYSLGQHLGNTSTRVPHLEESSLERTVINLSPRSLPVCVTSANAARPLLSDCLPRFQPRNARSPDFVLATWDEVAGEPHYFRTPEANGAPRIRRRSRSPRRKAIISRLIPQRV